MPARTKPTITVSLNELNDLVDAVQEFAENTTGSFNLVGVTLAYVGSEFIATAEYDNNGWRITLTES